MCVQAGQLPLDSLVLIGWGRTPPLLALRETRRGHLYRIKGVRKGMQSNGLDF